MNKFRSINIIASVLLLSVLLFASCEKDPVLKPKGEETQTGKGELKDIPWIKGEAYVKFTKEQNTKSASVLQKLESVTATTKSGATGYKLEPIFKIEGEYAKAMKREGLDRWFKVTFDESIDVQSVINELKGDKSIEYVHGALPIERTQMNYTAAHNPVMTKASEFPDFNNGYSKFNNQDPLLKKQWHYANERDDQYNFEPGADINLFRAWDVTTGDPRVIVAVIDSGIDCDHPDLQKSMWSDKDGNHGKNFVDDNFVLAAGYHGTHVAGTIAARNNNGIGVSGVAGGNGDPESGVRLMSCQIFGADIAETGGTQGSAKPDQIAQAFIWAAKNGAVIASCSWGYQWRNEAPGEYADKYAENNRLILEGIDFFIKYAGNDEDGNRKSDSMMSGGVVIFASGNDSAYDIDIVPSYNPAVISVGSFKPDYLLAEYSNTGSWVDILAPGGITPEQEIRGDYYFRGILSTVPTSFENVKVSDGIYGRDLMYPGMNQYAYAQGTSMATPHVSGIAALMVSHFGKDGKLTNTELKKRLLGSVKNVNFEEKNPGYEGKLGSGYIDAGYALQNPEQKAPAAVTVETVEVNYYDAAIKWNVTADEDAPNGTAFAYEVCISDKEVSAMPEDAAIVYSFENAVGAELKYEFKELESDKTYYAAVVAKDRYGNKSKISQKEFKTKLNHVPEFTNRPKEIPVILNTQPYYTYTYKVVDVDGHKWEYTNSELPKGVSLTRNGNDITLNVIVGEKVGSYSFDVVLKDELGGEMIERIEYRIAGHDAPSVVAELKDLSFVVNDAPVSIDLKDVFAASGALNLVYEAKSNSVDIVNVTIDGSVLTVVPIGKGTASVTVTANDGKMKAQTTFQVNVTDNASSDIYAVYPVPAHSYLKMLMHPSISNVDVKITSVRGELLINQNFTVDKNTNVVTVEVDRLVPGVYNMIVKSERATTKRTFIKD